MRRAIETAAFFGPTTIDARLAEVERPFVADPDQDIPAYLAGRPLQGWEPQSEAIARVDAAVVEHGDAIYVTHGTVMSLYVAACCPKLDAYTFWVDLRYPDAWSVGEGRAVRVG